jgi:hypothetical protein
MQHPNARLIDFYEACAAHLRGCPQQPLAPNPPSAGKWWRVGFNMYSALLIRRLTCIPFEDVARKRHGLELLVDYV